MTSRPLHSTASGPGQDSIAPPLARNSTTLGGQRVNERGGGNAGSKTEYSATGQPQRSWKVSPAVAVYQAIPHLSLHDCVCVPHLSSHIHAHTQTVHIQRSHKATPAVTVYQAIPHLCLHDSCACACVSLVFPHTYTHTNSAYPTHPDSLWRQSYTIQYACWILVAEMYIYTVIYRAQ